MFSRLMLCVFCAVVATWQYAVTSLARCGDCQANIAGIASGNFGPPFVHRPLTPALLVALGNTPEAYILFMGVMLVAFLLMLWGWVVRWGGNGAAAVGIATVVLIVMWPTYYHSVYTVTEWVLWLGGLMLLTGRWWRSEPLTAK